MSVDDRRGEGVNPRAGPSETNFLTRLYVPIDELEQALLVVSQSSVDEAIDDFLERQSARVDDWVTCRCVPRLREP